MGVENYRTISSTKNNSLSKCSVPNRDDLCKVTAEDAIPVRSRVPVESGPERRDLDPAPAAAAARATNINKCHSPAVPLPAARVLIIIN